MFAKFPDVWSLSRNVYLRKHIFIVYFYHHWSLHWNSFVMADKDMFANIVNTLGSAEDLETQGTRPSAVPMLTYVLQNISTSAPIRLNLNSSPGQNGHQFADDIFKCIFMNDKFCILIPVSLKFVPKSPIDNNPTLVQAMAWRRIGDKPLPEPMRLNSLTHVCSSRGRLVNFSNFRVRASASLRAASYAPWYLFRQALQTSATFYTPTFKT